MYPALRRGRMYPDLSKDVVSIQQGAMHGAPTVMNRTSLSMIVQNYKAEVTRRIRRNTQVYFTWQRNYYERVIRNEIELNQVRQYIQGNPLNWETDEENPKKQQR
ncbi:MAG: transposase [Nitrospirae bacterium]|nr:transposase [Nitrospirota bacterium]